MKCIFTSIALFWLCSVHAQQRFNLVLGGGINRSTYSVLNGAELGYASPIYTFNIGAQAIIPFSNRFGIQTGIELIQKGAHFDRSPNYSNDYFYHSTTRPLYLNVPLRFVYYIHPKAANTYFVGIGAHASLGLAGGYRLRYFSPSVGEDNFRTSVRFNRPPSPADPAGQGGGYLQKFDFGAGLSAGWIHKRMQASIHFEPGFYNVAWKGYSRPGTMYDKTFQLTIGYRIRK